MDDWKPVTVGIMGGSASGKTTFANALAKELEAVRPVILHQDHYFKDWAEYPPDVRERLRTANHPDAVRWGLLIEHVEALAARRPITPPRRRHADARGASFSPGDLVILEGHLILWHERIRDLMDIAIFLDVDPHERVLRRLLRDVAQRGGDLEQAIAWYRRDVIPNFPIYTEPCKRYANLIIPYADENLVALRTVAAGIRQEIARRGGPSIR